MFEKQQQKNRQQLRACKLAKEEIRNNFRESTHKNSRENGKNKNKMLRNKKRYNGI